VTERSPLRVPVCTLVFVCAATLVSAGPTASSDWLALERDAVQTGELWRIWSGHLWHGSPVLAVWDLAAIALLGSWVERRSRAELLAALGLGALLSSVAVLVVRPDLASYQGSSALASALFVTECLRLSGRGQDGFVRSVALLALVGLAIKVALESAELWPSPALAGSAALESVAVAHLAGALAGTLVRCAGDRVGQKHRVSTALRDVASSAVD
jgi:rhomboid family GlyGly-CTERM serine protease